MTAEQGFDLEATATLLSDVTEKVVKELAEEGLGDKPQIKKKALIEYEGKLRMAGLELFNESMYISAASFHLSDKDMEGHNACGAVVFYLKKEFGADLFKYVGIRGFDDESDEEMMSTAEGFYSKVADEFQKELGRKGYASLVRSPFSSHYNNASCGVDFPKKEFEICEITRSFKGNVALIMELTMMPLPQK